MRLAPAMLVLCCGCFGQPEDLFTIDGTVSNGNREPWAGATVFLERDDGASLEGCSGFSPFVTLTTDGWGRFHHQVIRQQTRGRLSELRCFRAFVVAEDGRRTTVVWPFTGADVRLPALKLWADDAKVVGHRTGVTIDTLPPAWRFVGDGASDFTYRAQLNTAFGRSWRASAVGNMFQVFANFDANAGLGEGNPTATAAAIQRIEHYDRDPFGQLKVAAYESRVESRPVSLLGNTALPFSRNATCAILNAQGTCALTDGDPTPVALPDAVRELLIDFGAPYDFGGPPLFPTYRYHPLYLRGLWVEGEWTALVIEMSVEETPDYLVFATVKVDKPTLRAAQVSRDDLLPGLDLGPIELPGRSLGFRRLRIHAVNNDQTVPIKSVGEVSVY